ncbi:allene oxide cyclase barrel-like domain-containing protein [Erwinia rhapontici]|uniref:allene oxide cyclase barrel-like domain-containing protein n=1 Tax=Erwinia rhapontici TaxID=55212 RepID=UPI00216A1980|nr:hypothetical protein [Erwinia rhapontici]MCS3605642.1 hypothetical protein [Erwinia rhapontici]
MEIIQGNNNVLSELIALANWVRAEIEQGSSVTEVEHSLAENKGYANATVISVVEMANIHFNAKTNSGPTVGDANSHVDHFIDERGELAGTMTGSGWKIAALADNSVVSYYHETAETPQGRIETSGIWNSSAIWASQWQSLLAVGVSGDVMGKVGVRQLYQEVPREKYRTLLVLVPLDQIKKLTQ